VQGVLASGLTGNPTADHACTEAWRPPNPADISLVGSGAEDPTGSAITATLEVSTRGTSAVAALGSRSTEYVYSIDGKAVSAPTTATTIQVSGLAPAVQHKPGVSVYPTGHPTAAVTVPGQPFSHTLKWPAVSMSVSPSIDANPNSGTLKLSFTGLPAGLLPGQIKVGGTLTCGSTSMPIGGGVTNGVLTPAPQYDVDTIGTGCGLSGMSLSDTAAVDPYGVSDPLSPFGPFDFGPQPSYSFSAAYGQPQCGLPFDCTYPVVVSYAGPGQEPPAGINWTISATGQVAGGKVCGASSGPTSGPQFPATVTLSGTCRNLTDVSVTVSWTYLGITTPSPWTGSPNGSPPPPPSTTTTSTLPPCPTTTTSTRPTSTKASTTTSTTRPCSASASPAGASATQLAASTGASALPPPALPGDPAVRDALGWATVAAGVAWCVGIIRRVQRRTRRRHGQRKEPS
jgi:hypothetical protein